MTVGSEYVVGLIGPMVLVLALVLNLVVLLTSLGSGSVLVSRERKGSLGEEECLQPRLKKCNRVTTDDSFYRAMLCIRGTSHGPVSACLSVCPSVTSRSSTKTAKRRITQTTPHNSPGTLVFGCQRSPRNSTGVTPYEGAKCRWGGSKSATFDK